MDVGALEESLRAARDSLNNWSDAATICVVVGLFLEYGVELYEAVRNWRWKPLTPGPLWGHRMLPKVGGVLVVLGIIGELWSHTRLATTDDKLFEIQRP